AWPSRPRTRAKVGMNAEASVAPAMSWKIRSGMRLPMYQASSSGAVPNTPASTTDSSAPSRRLPRYVAATMSEARARARGCHAARVAARADAVLEEDVDEVLRHLVDGSGGGAQADGIEAGKLVEAAAGVGSHLRGVALPQAVLEQPVGELAQLA